MIYFEIRNDWPNKKIQLHTYIRVYNRAYKYFLNQTLPSSLSTAIFSILAT